MIANNFDEKILRLGGVWLGINLINMLAWIAGLYIHPLVYFLLWLYSMYSFGHKSSQMWIILFLTLILGSIILSYPNYGFDSRYIWLFHAKRIFYDQWLFAQLDGYASWSHNDYPSLIPALAASMANSFGFWNEIIPRSSVLLALVPCLFILGSKFNFKGLFYLWIASIIWISTEYIINGYMDFYIGLYFSISLIFLNSKYHKWILLLLILSLTLIKNEGLLAGLLVSSAFIIINFNSPKQWSWVISPILIYIAVWKVPTIIFKTGGDLFQGDIFSRMIGRLNTGESNLIFEHSINEIGILFIPALIIFIFSWFSKDRKLELILPWACLLVYFFVVIFIYLITPHDLDWHLRTSANRVFMVINIGIATLAISQIDYYLSKLIGKA